VRRACFALVVLLVVGTTGCTSSTGPGGTGLGHPDIAGIIAFYQFDESLGNEISDTHHATSTDEDPIYVKDRHDRPNSAIFISGVGEIVSVPAHADFDFDEAFTLAAWVLPYLSYPPYCGIIDKDYYTGYSMGITGATEPEMADVGLRVSGASVSAEDVVAIGTLTWTHVACTYDVAAQSARFYINGTLADTRPLSVEIGTSDADIRFGMSQYGDEYVGAIDQVALFGRALSAAEVRTLHDFD